MKASPVHTVELGFTTLEFFDYHVVSRIKEEVVFDVPQLDMLVSTVNSFFAGRPFVYISERRNQYNVNPVIYSKLKEVKNLCGISIVIFQRPAKQTALYEKHFSKIPFEVFPNLEEALDWAQQTLNKKKADL